MHFKINPDWTNCRSVTSTSDTSNSKDEFSQHQDSSSTDAAIKIIIIHNTYHFKPASDMKIASTVRKSQIITLLRSCYCYVHVNLSSHRLHQIISIQFFLQFKALTTFVFSRKNIFKGERSVSDLKSTIEYTCTISDEIISETKR